MTTKTLYIEAQRLFRPQKHGMDVVALAVLRELQQQSFAGNLKVLVKPDADPCLSSSKQVEVEQLAGGFYPIWEQWTLPRRLAQDSGAWLHATGNTAPIWGQNPLIVTIHDLIYLDENYLWKKDGGTWYQRFGNTYRRWIVPLVARRAKHIITISEFQREAIIRQLGVHPSKVTVIYNGADDNFFRQRDQAELLSMREQLGLGLDPYIFFLANTEPRKNTDGVLLAYAQLIERYPECPYHLVLKGLSDELLSRKLVALGLTAIQSRIHRIGYIDADLLPSVYQGASMLWFPSFSEGFGLPIVEAMAGGVPVITSNCSVMPEIAADAALYINPAIPAEMVDQTVAIWQNPALAERLSNLGKLRAENFTWRTAVKKLIEVYQRCGAC